MHALSYCQLADNTMENLQILISDTTDPIFIVDEHDREVILANDAATSGCEEIGLAGSVFDDMVYLDDETVNPSNAFFNSCWYKLNRKSFHWEGNDYLKITLKKGEDLPGEE